MHLRPRKPISWQMLVARSRPDRQMDVYPFDKNKIIWGWGAEKSRKKKGRSKIKEGFRLYLPLTTLRQRERERETRQETWFHEDTLQRECNRICIACRPRPTHQASPVHGCREAFFHHLSRKTLPLFQPDDLISHHCFRS